jgi:hypothetical protein
VHVSQFPQNNKPSTVLLQKSLFGVSLYKKLGNFKKVGVSTFYQQSNSATTATPAKKQRCAHELVQTTPSTNPAIITKTDQNQHHKKHRTFLTNALQIAENYLWERVAQSTRSLYQTGFRRFIDFLPRFGTDLHFTVIPKDWIIETNQYRVHYTFPEAVILAFLAYLRGCAGHNPVIPKTAFTYLAGVKFMMVNLGIDTKFIDHSPVITGVKTGMYKSWRKE